MRVQNNVLVMDTETVGDFGQPLIHDFGYQIVDKDFNVLVERNWLVREIYETKSLLNTEFYAGKKKIYQDMIKNGQVETLPWKQIMKIFMQDMRKYKVKVVAAYNIAFDYRALNATMHLLDYETFESKKIQDYIDSKNLLCIWNLACETMLQDEEYKTLAKANGWVSEKGNIQTNAEVSYRYLTGNHSFIESHTALDDVKIETIILKHILTNCKGKIEYGLAYGAWRKLVTKA